MKVIIIGAGRGRRLKPYTDDCPKCLVPVQGKPILTWILDAFRGAGLHDITFVGGYRMADIQRAHPELRFVENDAWENNNILASLFYAEPQMEGGFICAYSDTILLPHLIRATCETPGDIVLSVDTSWNERHGSRPTAYQDHVEGVYLEDDRVRTIRRILPPGDAVGEFTGVARFSAAGASAWRAAFHRAKAMFSGKPFHHGKTFEKAYLVDLVQELINGDADVRIAPVARGYIEIDTVEDYRLANEAWIGELGAP